MKIFLKLFIVALFLLCYSNSFSQQDSTIIKIIFNKDTLIVGKYYTFYLKFDETLIGKLISKKDEEFIIYSEKEIKNLNINSIEKISQPSDYLYKKYYEDNLTGKDKHYFYFGAGYLFTRPASNTIDNYSDGFGLNVDYLQTFSDMLGVRFDIEYNHLIKKDISYTDNYSYLNYSSSFFYTGGAYNSFTLKGNLTVGWLNPNSRLNVYIIPAIGCGLGFRTERNIIYRVEGNEIYTSTEKSYTSHLFGVSIGVGFTFKIKGKIKIFAEYQNDYWSANNYFYPKYGQLKAGIVF